MHYLWTAEKKKKIGILTIRQWHWEWEDMGFVKHTTWFIISVLWHLNYIVCCCTLVWVEGDCCKNISSIGANLLPRQQVKLVLNIEMQIAEKTFSDDNQWEAAGTIQTHTGIYIPEEGLTSLILMEWRLWPRDNNDLKDHKYTSLYRHMPQKKMLTWSHVIWERLYQWVIKYHSNYCDLLSVFKVHLFQYSKV